MQTDDMSDLKYIKHAQKGYTAIAKSFQCCHAMAQHRTEISTPSYPMSEASY